MLNKFGYKSLSFEIYEINVDANIWLYILTLLIYEIYANYSYPIM